MLPHSTCSRFVWFAQREHEHTLSHSARKAAKAPSSEKYFSVVPKIRRHARFVGFRTIWKKIYIGQRHSKLSNHLTSAYSFGGETQEETLVFTADIIYLDHFSFPHTLLTQKSLDTKTEGWGRVRASVRKYGQTMKREKGRGTVDMHTFADQNMSLWVCLHVHSACKDGRVGRHTICGFSVILRATQCVHVYVCNLQHLVRCLYGKKCNSNNIYT